MSSSLSVVPVDLLLGASLLSLVTESSERFPPLLSRLEVTAGERLPGWRTTEALAAFVGRWQPIMTALVHRGAVLSRALAAAGGAYAGLDRDLSAVAELHGSR